MATIVTRAGKGAALTHQEVDANFTGLNTELGQKEVASNKGVANGYASLDAAGKVPSAQLPSYVDDVVEVANLASLPGTGETGKIYVTIDTNKTYRWTGSTYIEISASPGSTDSLAEGSTNLYFTQARARASLSASGSLSYNSSTGVMSFTDAVTSVAGRTGAVTLTSSDVGLGSVENKSSATIRGELTSGNVTTALGFTPYNSSNPSGYITSSASITGNAATATTATRSTIEDTRAAQRTPNGYDDYRASYEFTNLIVGSDWHTAFTMQGWHDGYAAWQIIGPASTSAHENWYLRSGINTTWNPTRAILHAGNYTSYSPSLTGSGASGTWAISISGSAAQLNGLSSTQLFNNMGVAHSGFGSGFDSVTNFGPFFIQGTGQGPGTGSSQFYGLALGLGNDYAYSSFSLQLAIPRYNSSDKYITMRTRESGTWGSWTKISAGYADTAGSATDSTKLPLSGGTLTGAIYVGTTGSGSATRALRVGPSGASPASFGSYAGSWRSTIEIWDNAATRMLHLTPPDGTNYNYSSIKSTDAGLRIDVGGSGGTNAIDIGTNGVANFPQGLQQGGNQVLHAGNYTSYSPSLTGSGASGTWGISLSSATNSALWRPNIQSYGAWEIAGSRNGYTGIACNGTSHILNWMVDMGGNLQGWYNQSYGWQMYWSGGTLSVFKNSFGGGTQATVLDSANYSSYALPLSGGTLSGDLTLSTGANRTIQLGSATNYYWRLRAAGDDFRIIAGADTATAMAFQYSTWNVGIGTTSPSYKLHVVGDIYATSNVTAYSDERVKANWRPIDDGFVVKLAGVKSGIYDRTDIELTQAGVSAQSLRNVLPQTVMESSEGELSVAYGNAALVSAVELAKELVALKHKVAELEARVH